MGDHAVATADRPGRRPTAVPMKSQPRGRRLGATYRPAGAGAPRDVCRRPGPRPTRSRSTGGSSRRHPQGPPRAHGVCGRGTGSARWWSCAQKAGRYDIDVANQVGVADGELDAGSLAEKRAREGGRSLGEHGTYGANPYAFALKNRNRHLDDHAIKPVSAACLPRQRETLLAADAEHLIVRLSQQRYPADAVLEIHAVLETRLPRRVRRGPSRG